MIGVSTFLATADGISHAKNIALFCSKMSVSVSLDFDSICLPGDD